MARIWVICPVIVDNDVRMPKVARIEDTGTPLVEHGEVGNSDIRHSYYSYSAGIDVKDWCICNVTGVDMSALESDQQVIILVENGESLNATMKSLGWDSGRKDKVKNIIVAKGADISGMTGDTPLWEYLEKLGKLIQKNFQPKGTWVKE